MSAAVADLRAKMTAGFREIGDAEIYYCCPCAVPHCCRPRRAGGGVRPAWASWLRRYLVRNDRLSFGVRNWPALVLHCNCKVCQQWRRCVLGLLGVRRTELGSAFLSRASRRAIAFVAMPNITGATA